LGEFVIINFFFLPVDGRKPDSNLDFPPNIF
jgi:hypothetical protein